MNGELRVDHGSLEAAAQDLAAAASAIDDRLQRLQAELAPLRAEWTGEAQVAYLSAQARWDAAMREMRSVLATSAVDVSRANADYRSADLRGARAFGG